MGNVLKTDLNTYLQTQLEQIREKGLYRSLRSLDSAADAVVMADGRRLIQFSSNNYLGFANHPVLRQAAANALEQYGVGVGASRLIAGNCSLYQKLEERLMRFKETEAALVFPTGYQANLGVITALAGPEDIIFSDELNHASIVDGCRLSGAAIIIYPHRNLDVLEKRIRTSPAGRNRLIITDGVFSMDGTIAPLAELSELARHYGCWIMVDEAHATGVLGKRGSGTAEHFHMKEDIHIHMGTFSKALGSLGGYIAGSRTLIDYLINKSRNLMYTTGLPPAVLSVNYAALELAEQAFDLRNRLWDMTHFFRKRLVEAGFNTLESETPIIPLVIGDAAKTVQFSRRLFEQGINAHGIRPPTVAEGLSRLRISLIATHTWEDLHYALDVIEKAGKAFNII